MISALIDSRVASAELPEARYDWPEDRDELYSAIVSVCSTLGWAHPVRGCLGNIIPENSRVVIKPNLVIHRNQGDGGLLPLVTNARVIQIVTEESLKANPKQVIVGDAPIQSCDFNILLESMGLREWADDLSQRDNRFLGIEDFRRTINVNEPDRRISMEDVQPLDDYILFDLASESLLEPITTEVPAFRVTSYDPAAMAKTHSSGSHQYLIAKSVIDADVVINLPKLKTHKKAGITNALKNLVGINGNKEFLPHHRIGGSNSGGDCYPGSSVVKRALEKVLDFRNSNRNGWIADRSDVLERPLYALLKLSGDKVGVEGSWVGNMTVPRMTLDLNRIALYGNSDSTLSDSIQRNVYHIVDAVIAGQGDGPLASDEFPVGRIFAGSNAVAVDWVGAKFLGYEADRIPLLYLAFEDFRWKLADFRPEDVRIYGGYEKEPVPLASLVMESSERANLPSGWIDARK